MSDENKPKNPETEETREIPQAVIERLSAEKEELDNEDRDIGEKDGFDWAGDASLVDILAIVNGTMDQRELSDLMQEREKEIESGLVHDPAFAAFEEGFIEGVKDFYEEVKGRL